MHKIIPLSQWPEFTPLPLPLTSLEMDMLPDAWWSKPEMYFQALVEKQFHQYD